MRFFAWLWPKPVRRLEVHHNRSLYKVKLKKIVIEHVEKTGSCVIMGKVNRTEKQAKARAAKPGGIKLRAYKCEFCPWWHLTHKKQKLQMH